MTCAVCWLVPDDRGGGVVSVAEACCRQAAAAGQQPTLLLLLSPTGHVAEFANFDIESVGSVPPHDDAPGRIVAWLKANPQRIIYVNGCEQADVAIPYIPSGVRCVYVVHDTAERYFAAALRHEAQIDAIIAVSETVASVFRHRLQDPNKLHVIHNGTVFPHDLEEVLHHDRADDLIFLGGANPSKGAYDALAVWRELQRIGFEGRLHWFGPLSEGFRLKLEKAPNQQNLLVYGRVPRSTIFKVAMTCKVLLMLSRVEPFGMATVETVGMGCTPVAWDIDTGTKEIIASKEGHFVPLGAYSAMARVITTACLSHRAEFGALTARVRGQFGETSMGAKYVAFAGSLLNKPGITRPLAGMRPPRYRRPIRLFQLLPRGVREKIREAVGRSARLGYRLRNMRGY